MRSCALRQLWREPQRRAQGGQLTRGDGRQVCRLGRHAAPAKRSLVVYQGPCGGQGSKPWEEATKATHTTTGAR